MRRSNKEKTTGSKGFEPSMVQGLARCGGRGGAGAASPSSSDCNRCERRGGAGIFTSLVGDCNKMATWNVRSLYVSLFVCLCLTARQHKKATLYHSVIR